MKYKISLSVLECNLISLQKYLQYKYMFFLLTFNLISVLSHVESFFFFFCFFKISRTCVLVIIDGFLQV
jgi:hypothetical protein